MKCPACAKQIESKNEAIDIQLMTGKCFDCQMRGASIFGHSEFAKYARQELAIAGIVEIDTDDTRYVN